MKLSVETAPRYFTKIEDRIGGPFTIEGLESLVYLQKVTPDTLVRREGTDDFVAVRDCELGLVLFKHMLAGMP